MPQSTPIIFKPIGKPEIGNNNYQGFTPNRTEILKKGSNHNNAKPLKSDIRVEHDVEIKARDGIKMYADIYRPAEAGDEKLPAIIPMWCPRGYAIINVDARGAGNSEGSVHVMGSQDGEDCYDVIEAIAAMDWCSGKIGMAGNSALAIIQWRAAELNPPHLAAIAPWEGSGDIYREQFNHGGWFHMSNFDLISTLIIKGNNGVEDMAAMYEKYPLSNPFWADKRADMSKVKCPVYISGSDFSSMHTMGSVRGWMTIPHDKKWIRWSSAQEWFELYCHPESDVELHRYFDFYLRGQDNGWEMDTPKVRWSALQFGNREAIDNIELEDYPVPGTEYREMFLHSGTLNSEPAKETSVSTYDSTNKDDFADFTYTFKNKTRLIGLPKAVLYVSCEERDDLIIFVTLRKRDAKGNLLMHLNFPFKAMPYNTIEEIPLKEQAVLNLHKGSMGILRASHRAYDQERSLHPQFPFHPHDKEEKIPPGTIVKLEIGIWSIGYDFDAGESISVQIGGQLPAFTEYDAFSKPRPEHEKNKGTHKIHTGPEHPSSIILPFIPQ
nr:hypothetical protein B0A51_11025 [Rachicladosporium sp. CCFEE 5018]